MKRIIWASLLVLCTLLLASCSIRHNSDIENTRQMGDLSEKNNEAYEITNATYTDKKVQIEYPQIINMQDSNKQKTINEIIADDAYGFLKNDAWQAEEFGMEINYEIKWKSSRFLSIQYTGLNYDNGAAHPVHQFYTMNIDIHNEKKLTLTDLVIIDESWVKKFKERKFKETMAEHNYILDTFTTEEWRTMFNKADTAESEIYSYFTEKALGVSVGVAHAVGDHAEFEINYEDIRENIKIEHEVWSELLQK